MNVASVTKADMLLLVRIGGIFSLAYCMPIPFLYLFSIRANKNHHIIPLKIHPQNNGMRTYYSDDEKCGNMHHNTPTFFLVNSIVRLADVLGSKKWYLIRCLFG